MFLLTTESVSPDLIKYLESENNSFITQVDYYIQSFLAFLITSVLTTLLLLFTIWIIARVIKYWKADLVKSAELQHGLLVDTNYGMKSIVYRVNRIVKGSIVCYRRNQVVLKIPTKNWWQVWTQVEAQREIKKRITAAEFHEWLATHYSGYRFGDLVVHENYYELIGEVY